VFEAHQYPGKHELIEMWNGAICIPGVVHKKPFPHDTGVTVVVLEQ